MSEPRILSPLLDGFALGNSMSDHHGVSAFPAMRMDSDERYIVKSISVPQSQTQLEALLLTGAYPDAEAARDYFRELVQNIEEEARILEKLSQQRGFVPYEAFQTEPMEEGVGFDCYLLSPYRRSLERHLKRQPMTHLSAVNMGIDLCAALVLCREAGYLYVDLKPANIFLSGQQEYHIGDLGFIALDSLKYASLPDRYRSFWTAPEVADAYAAMNDTMDIYALGLVLYQVYNNGKLPFDSEESRQKLYRRMQAGEPLPAPEYADYEMAQIIAKACAADPAERWQSPNEMGHALIMYMQRNGANDVPIGPPVLEEQEEVPAEVPEEEIPEPLEEAAVSEEIAEEISDGSAEEEVPAEELPAEEDGDDWIERIDAILAEDAEDGEDAVSLRDVLENTDDLESEEDALDAESLTEGTADILSQADELIAHETPDPVVVPEEVELPSIEPVEEEAEEPAEEASEEAPEEEIIEDEVLPEEPEQPKKGKKILGWIIGLMIAALLGTGAYYYYNEYYLQEVSDLTVSGQRDEMTVNLTSELDESKITVVCVDQYGKKLTSPVIGGAAAFIGLDPDTQYTITLEAEGFHKLTGKITAQYYTLPQTNITGFTAATGPEDGSVILSINSEGPAVEGWTVEYSAEGVEPASISFTGSMITIPGLMPGTEYTFLLSSSSEVDLTGQTELKFIASNSIYAQDLVVSSAEGALTVTWNAPEGVEIAEWTVRCFNAEGYSESVTTTERSATFASIDPAFAYNLEIVAQGMNQGTVTTVSANPIQLTKLTTAVTDSGSIAVAWEYAGEAPAGGWLLVYTVEGGSDQHVVQCDGDAAIIAPAAPGSSYQLSVQAADTTTVLGGTTTVEIPQPEAFNKYGVRAEDVLVIPCAAPEKDNWVYGDITTENKRSTYALGEKAGLLLSTKVRMQNSKDNVTTVFVIRDEAGALVCISATSFVWRDFWDGGGAVLEVPQMPGEAGTYSLHVYMVGQLLTAQTIVIE